MVKKHNPREHSAHKRSTKRPENEYWRVEITSFEHDLTKAFYPSANNINLVTNVGVKSFRSMTAYISADTKQSFTISCDYTVQLSGEHRIDIFYEVFDSADKPLSGKFKGETVKFDGTLQHLKRKTFFVNYSKGKKTLTFKLPKNVYFYGVIVRKTKQFVGDAVNGVGTNITVTETDFSSSSQINPSEINFVIKYDNALEYSDSPTGLYIDYNDEVNVYLKNDMQLEEKQIFGGYLSTILPNDKHTELNVSCADRMIDGQNRYILSQISILGGTKNKSEKEFDSTMDINFDKYGQALKYLCNSMETTLKNDIADNNLVTGETAKKGFNIEFGKNKQIKKISCKNGAVAFSKNFATLRNSSSATNKQSFILYNGKDHTNKPVEITNYTNFGLVYGLGKAKTEHDEKTTETVSTGTATTGTQSFNKCGVSKDGKYIMAIGLPSASGDIAKVGGIKWKKRMYKNECPYCKSRGMASNKLVFDIFYGDSTYGAGRSSCNNNRYESGGGVEGHIFCRTCDSDYSIITGKRHGGVGGNLTPVSALQDSSKSEAQKLKAGNYTGEVTGESLSADDIFDAIWKLAKKKKLKYKLYGTTYQTAEDLERHGIGDCWAFSDWIFKQLKGYKVNCRIVQYATAEAPNGTHRTVQYKNSKNQWADYPYRSHGWHNYLYNTSGSKHPNAIIKKYTAGGKISDAKSGSSTKTQTTTVKVSDGYDRDKPLQGYFAVTVSTVQSFKADTRTYYVGFTQKAGSTYSITGFNPIWINETVKQINVDLLKFIKAVQGKDNRYFLHSIKFIAPVNKVQESDGKWKVEDWYTNDKSTKDNASCKMDLYSINFNDATLINPTDLESCGKSINSLFSDLLGTAKYTAHMVYGKHRCDDTLKFSVDNKTEPSFTAHEGDDNNILEISGISYTPRSNLFNRAITVFKTNKNKYKYVDTTDVESIFKYGEQTTLTTSSEVMGSKEAYYNAINNENYNPNETFNFSITLPFFVDTYVGDIVKVIANSRKLNTIKTVASVKYKVDNHKIPKIQTELGLGELPADLQIRKELREIRAMAKKESTYFTKSAEPVLDENVYEWDN